jgi:cysteinyl-tRNA synthetase
VLRLYDTRTRQVEPIGPARQGGLRMYTCGPDTSRAAHIGDLRCHLLADLIRRAAERSQLQVISCLNIIDVGQLTDGNETSPDGADEIIAQARAEGRSALDVARHYEAAFRADCAALNIHPADSIPRASESVELMIELISKLLETGHAYPTAAGSVYFDGASFPSYGELSGHPLDADLALWRAAPAGRELTWTAPWGTGFPGWATACSAMSLHYLGDTIDVHTGGIGLRFPHHEDERAQSDSVSGHEVVRHWVHGEHLLFEGREMAKSTGNVVLLGDLAGRGLDPLALRLACIEHRYRQQLNLAWSTLEAADATVRRWRQQVADWASSPSRPMCAQYVADFLGAFNDDLDTPAALRVLRELEQDREIPPGAKFETFAYADHLLGLDLARDIGRAPVPPAR